MTAYLRDGIQHFYHKLCAAQHHKIVSQIKLIDKANKPHLSSFNDATHEAVLGH